MALNSFIDDLNDRNPNIDTLDGITIGKVVDCKDPMQMGRLRVRCPAWGDPADPELLEQIPWASYCSPLAGAMSSLNRGPEDTKTPNNGQVMSASISYGFWAVPKPGTQCLVFCIDGDPNQRVWFGQLHAENMTHTMPHGRHLLQNEGQDVNGPLTSGETHIEPLYSQQSEAFRGGSKNSQGQGRNSYEWVTRGADYSVGNVSPGTIGYESSPTQLRDDFQAFPPTISRFTEAPAGGGGDFDTARNVNVITQGYSPQRRSNAQESGSFDFETQTYSWTTPGFHAFAMDDRPENCRVRIRTTKGQQIVFDDTNERIYISTSQGKNWIELDEKGNVDVFAERRINIHAEKDINFTTDETFRVTAKKGIHLETPDIYRLHAGKDIDIICDQNIRQVSKQETFLESLQDFNVYSNAQMLLYSQKNMHQKTGSEYRATSASTMHHRSGSTMFFTGGPIIHLNGPAARQADNADQCDCKLAFWTNRVPEHEPWSRAVMKDWEKNLSHNTLEFPYTDENINKMDSGDDLNRNRFWRR